MNAIKRLKDKFINLGDGRLYYDGMVRTLYNNQSIAGGGVNSNATDISSSPTYFHSQTINSGGTNPNSIIVKKKFVTFYKRFGENKLILNGKYYISFSQYFGSGTYTVDAKIFLQDTTLSVTNNMTVYHNVVTSAFTTSPSSFTLQLDITGLTDNEDYTIYIEDALSITPDPYNASTDRGQFDGYLSQNLSLLVTTK